MINPTRRCREIALQFLYIHEQNDGESALSSKDFVHWRIRDRKHRNRALLLIQTAIDHRDTIDEKLAQIVVNWDVPRITTIDRNILRVGACELIHLNKTPPRVAVAEAIRLAERYGTDRSYLFVNGMLSQLYATFIQGNPKLLGVHGNLDELKSSPKLEAEAEAETEVEPEPESETETESQVPAEPVAAVDVSSDSQTAPVEKVEKPVKAKSGLGMRARAATARMKP